MLVIAYIYQNQIVTEGFSDAQYTNKYYEVNKEPNTDKSVKEETIYQLVGHDYYGYRFIDSDEELEQYLLLLEEDQKHLFEGVQNV